MNAEMTGDQVASPYPNTAGRGGPGRTGDGLPDLRHHNGPEDNGRYKAGPADNTPASEGKKKITAGQDQLSAGHAFTILYQQDGREKKKGEDQCLGSDISRDAHEKTREKEP